MSTPLWYRREITLGMEGPDVRVVRRKMSMDPDGPYDVECMSRVLGAVGYSTVDDLVAERLGESAAEAAGLVPEWFTHDLQLGDTSEGTSAVCSLLGLPSGDAYGHEVDAAVRRLQSSLRMEPDGVVTEELARYLGEV